METQLFGSLVSFGDLNPGEVFISNWNDTPVFGVVAKFQEDKRTISVAFRNPIAPAFELGSQDGNESVWRIDSAIVRPKIKCGELQLTSKPSAGALVLEGDGAYLLCTDKGSLRRLNLETGLIYGLGSLTLITTRWEIGIRDNQSQQWCPLYDSAIATT